MNNLKPIAAIRRKQYINLILKRVRPGTGSQLDLLMNQPWRQKVMDLKLIFQKTPFVIVGGIATRLYIPERMTDDIDILIRSEDAEIATTELAKSEAIFLKKN